MMAYEDQENITGQEEGKDYELVQGCMSTT